MTFGISCYDERNAHITFDQFTREILANIGMIMTKARKGDARYAQASDTPTQWRLDVVKFRRLRIFQMKYIRNTWVPIFGVEQ